MVLFLLYCFIKLLSWSWAARICCDRKDADAPLLKNKKAGIFDEHAHLLFCIDAYAARLKHFKKTMRGLKKEIYINKQEPSLRSQHTKELAKRLFLVWVVMESFHGHHAIEARIGEGKLLNIAVEEHHVKAGKILLRPLKHVWRKIDASKLCSAASHLLERMACAAACVKDALSPMRVGD